MDYKMEDLVPVVSELAEKYTSHESTSISYEKAEQLMGAVLYCLHELEMNQHNSITQKSGYSARQLYKMGLDKVKEKVNKALNLYNDCMSEFDNYENECLYDTILKGIPAFFQYYDVQLEPQNTILTLDYPILVDLTEYQGIDCIYLYIQSIGMEQKFLKKFDRDYILNTLRLYSDDNKNMVENICLIILTNIIGHIAADKPLSEGRFENKDYRRIRGAFNNSDVQQIKEKVWQYAEKLLKTYVEDYSKLIQYMGSAVDDIAVRLRSALMYDSLEVMFQSNK